MTKKKDKWKNLVKELSKKESLVKLETEGQETAQLVTSRPKMIGQKAVLSLVVVVLLAVSIIILKPQLEGLYGKIFSKKPFLNTEVIDLHRMVILNKVEDIKNIFARFRYRDEIDEYGWTPLHFAALLNNKDMARILIKNGARKNIRSTKSWHIYPLGVTPRDIALLNKNYDLLEIL